MLTVYAPSAFYLFKTDNVVPATVALVVVVLVVLVVVPLQVENVETLSVLNKDKLLNHDQNPVTTMTVLCCYASISIYPNGYCTYSHTTAESTINHLLVRRS